MKFVRAQFPITIATALLFAAAPATAQEKDSKPNAKPDVQAPAAAGAKAEAPKETGALPKEQQAPGWAVQCANPGKGLACRASQTVIMAKTRQLLTGVSVTKPEAGKDAAMMLHLPLGLFNPAGVTLTVDDQKAETLAIQTCDAKGCYAGAAMTPERMAAMSKGTKLSVTFQDLNKKPITIPVPLKGFEDAFKKL